MTSLDLLSTDVQETLTESEDQLVPGRVEASHQERVEPPKLRAILRPLAPQRFYLKVTLGQDTHDMLLYAQRLLSLQVEPGDVAAVIHRALQTLIQRLEKQEFAATSAPRQGRLTSEQGRAISAQVRRTVWERDGGQCTFVSDAGHRCESRSALEFDHALAFARGGKPTAENIRLLCRAHNQHAAELTFGSGFMEGKREFRMAGQRHR